MCHRMALLAFRFYQIQHWPGLCPGLTGGRGEAHNTSPDPLEGQPVRKALGPLVPVSLLNR